jgi:hypothetical protein
VGRFFNAEFMPTKALNPCGRLGALAKTGFTRERKVMKVKYQTRTSKGKTAALAVLLVASVGGYARAADMPVKAMPAQQPVPFFSANNTSVSFTYYPDATGDSLTQSFHGVAFVQTCRGVAADNVS